MLDVAGKRVHIIGLGARGTGRACARVLSGLGAHITISDAKEAAALADEVAQLADIPVEFRLGATAYRDIERADLVVPSPGVPLAIEPIRRARAAGVPVWSEIELAYRLSLAPIAAITGTKGKTTTTTLAGLLIAATGQRVHVGGNIGIPLIELAVRAAPDDILLAEISSFQLEAVETFRPKVAAFTNLYPDHLDRYDDSMEAYLAAKLNLFARQTPEDIAVVNLACPRRRRVEASTRARIVHVSIDTPAPGGVWVEDGQVYSEVSGRRKEVLPVSAIRLRGRHNLANVLMAVAVVAACGLPVEEVAAAVLADFRGVPNRLEEVDTVDGVTFYNDSQGTTPVSVRMALHALAETPPVLIAGGRAKVTDFAELGEDIARYARGLIVIGEAAEAIAGATRAALSSHRDADPFAILHAASLPEAVQLGFQMARPTGVVLLSPACASFDMFTNMEQRGEVFRQAVAHLDGERVGNPCRTAIHQEREGCGA